MELINFKIQKFDNLFVNCDLRFIPDNRKKALVIFLHGFKSFRNWGFIPFCCEFLAKKGFMVINFDYSTNGIIDSEKSIFDPEIFARQTISSHLNDFLDLVEKIKKKDILINNYLSEYWNNQIFTIGHSMGGAISLLGYDKVRQDKIVLWATISQIDRNTERQKQIWKDKGYTEIKIMPSEQILHLNYSYIEDKEKNFADNSIVNSLKFIEIPVLIIHPKNDMVVKINEAEELYKALEHNNRRELYYIEGAGHTFSISHPFNNSNIYLDEALNKTLDFLKK